jgi:hypothetical protein
MPKQQWKNYKTDWFTNSGTNTLQIRFNGIYRVVALYIGEISDK